MSSRIALLLSYAAIMMSAIFIPNYALAIGASMSMLGVIGAGYGISMFFSSYFFSRASDKTGRKLFLHIGLLLSALFFLLQIPAKNPTTLLIVRAMSGASLGIFTGPLIAYAHDTGEGMGTFSSYGSFGWAIGSLLAGFIAQRGESLTHLNLLAPYWMVFFTSCLFFLMAFISLNRITEVGFVPQKPAPLFPKKIIAKNLRIYLSAFLRNLGAYAIWIIFPLYLSELGASKLMIGVLYFINMGGQALIMRRLDLAKSTGLIKIGLLLSSLVFVSFALAPGYIWIIPLQILLAFSYSSLYVGDLLYLTENNTEKATSVGILNSILGICIGIGPLIGGILSETWGFESVMYAASILALTGYLVMLKEK